MSAPSASTSCGYIAFTVAAVPTGVKAGVRMTPRGVTISPCRAAPSRARMWNSKPSAMRGDPLSRGHGGEQADQPFGVSGMGDRQGLDRLIGQPRRHRELDRRQKLAGVGRERGEAQDAVVGADQRLELAARLAGGA